MEKCEFGIECPCNKDVVEGDEIDVLFKNHPELDMRGKDVQFGTWDGQLCPLEMGDEDGICVHHQVEGLPCDMMWFCMTRDGEFEDPDEGSSFFRPLGTLKIRKDENMDLIHEYVRFCFNEYEKNPRGWITKNPPSVAEFREQLWLREQSEPGRMLFGFGKDGNMYNPLDILGNEELECLDDYGDDECLGEVEYRYALSVTGRSFPRCAYHWNLRLVEQERINDTYGSYDSDVEPDWFDPLDAGERWDDDY